MYFVVDLRCTNQIFAPCACKYFVTGKIGEDKKERDVKGVLFGILVKAIGYRKTCGPVNFDA